MNQKLDNITLTSGEVLQKGQWIQLGDKIAAIFPQSKGNIYPARSYSFLNWQAYDFKFVWSRLSDDNIFYNGFLQAHKAFSLSYDKVQYFTIEEGTRYCYTQFFKIEIQSALDLKEVTFLSEDDVCEFAKEKERQDLQRITETVVERYNQYIMGLITDAERDTFITDAVAELFFAKKRWFVPANNSSLMLLHGAAFGFDL